MTESMIIEWLKTQGPWFFLVGGLGLMFIRVVAKGGKTAWDWAKPMMESTVKKHNAFVDAASELGKKNSELLQESTQQQKTQTAIIQKSADKLDVIANCVQEWTLKNASTLTQHSEEIADIRRMIRDQNEKV